MIGLVILVTGGRDFQDYEKLKNVLDNLKPALIIEGGASGADALAKKYAVSSRIMYREVLADWYTHGKAAGPIRNQNMIDELLKYPNRSVVAFPGGKGTADCVARAKKAGIEVQEVA